MRASGPTRKLKGNRSGATPCGYIPISNRTRCPFPFRQEMGINANGRWGTMYGVFIYDDLITDPNLSSHDVRLWLLLAKLSRKHSECFATVHYLSEQLHLSKPTVFRSLKNLEWRGYLIRTHKPGKATSYRVMSNQTGIVFKGEKLSNPYHP